MENREVLGVNNKKVSDLITNFILIKNLPTHYKFVRKSHKGKLLNKKTPVSPFLYLMDLVKKHPELEDRIAIKENREITYGELISEAIIVSQYLHNIIKANKGENIAICASSSIEGIEAFFAMNSLGLVNARIFNGSKKDKLNANLKNFASKTIFTDAHNIDELANSLKDTNLQNVILMDEVREEKINHFKELNPLIHIIPWQEIQQHKVDYDHLYFEQVETTDMASILYTSGSSGDPKPISIPNRVYVNMPDIVISTTDMPICDSEKAVGVVSHEYPYAAINSTVMILLMGKTLIMPKHTKDNKMDFDDLFSNYPEKIQAIPNFYKLLESAKEKGELKLKDASFLSTIVSGGETFSKEEKIETIHFLNSLLADPLLIDGFGFGELGSATALKFGLSDYFLLMNGIEAKAIDPETGKTLKSGEEGILCITSPSIADGYYQNEEATQNSFFQDSKGVKWFKSDTYGSVHGLFNRLIKLGGRIREYFITGDGNGNFVKVYAGNVERAILSTGIVKTCVVVPSDSKGLPTPVAYVSLLDNCKLTDKEVEEKIEEACQTLEAFAQPSEIKIEEEIKRTEANKKDYGYYRKLQLERGKTKTK